MLAVLAIAFLPYAVFQLLFHETVTVRYALPLVVPVVFLAWCFLSVRFRMVRVARCTKSNTEN